MFQPSHFQKVARQLGMSSMTYESEYEVFMAKLKKFHQSKGTPFRRLPWLGGQYLDLYLLYKKVTAAGGWVKITEEKRWRDIAEVFNLPPTCTNAAFALRQHYTRYLELFERINFLGEDVEDVFNSGRPHTPVTSFITSSSDYSLSSLPEKDASRNFDKLVLSLQCGLPNEVDFAINICMLLSNVSNSVFNLQKAPAVVDALLAHAGIFSEDAHGLREVYKDWYQNKNKDLLKFWRDVLVVKDVKELLGNSTGDPEDEEDSIFCGSSRAVGVKDSESQRVAQICLIVYNFSFDDTNATVLASHGLCLRFLLMCVCSKVGFLQRVAWETLSHMAEKIVLEPVVSRNTQVLFQTLHHFLEDKDRFHVVNAMEFIGKLCTQEQNDEVIEEVLHCAAYESLIKVLLVHDVQLVIASLEALYNLSGVGQTTSDHIANIHRSIDILVCLVTLEVESFGIEALSEVHVTENRRAVARVAPSNPVPSSAAVPARVPSPAAPQPQPPPQVPQAPQVTQTPQPAGRNEIDAETFTFSWLQATYEAYATTSVSRIDLYADYLSSCSRLARIGILNATSFNRVVKMAFPDVQLRRVQTSTQMQYALVGVRRKANPSPVQSRIEPTQQQNTAAHSRLSASPGAAVPQPPQRAPTPPTQNQSPPLWNAAGQPAPRVIQQGQGMTQQVSPNPAGRPFEQRAVQGRTGAGIPLPVRRNSLPGQQQQQPQQQQQQQQQVPGQRPATPEALVQGKQALKPQDRPNLERIATLQRLNAERAALLQQRQEKQRQNQQGHERTRPPRILPNSSRSGLQSTPPLQPAAQNMQIHANQSPVTSPALRSIQPRMVQQPLHDYPQGSTVRQSFPSNNAMSFPPHNPSVGQIPSTGQSLPAHSPVAQATVQRSATGPPSAPILQPSGAGYNFPSTNTPLPRASQPVQNSVFIQQRVQEQALLPSQTVPAPFAPQVNYQQHAQGNQLNSSVPSSSLGPSQFPGFPQMQAAPVTAGQRVLPRLAPNPAQLPRIRQQVPASLAAFPENKFHGRGVPSAIQPGSGKSNPGHELSSRTINSAGVSDGVVLIAKEERAHDIGAAELVDGAEEQAILVVENTSRAGVEMAENPNKNCVATHRTNGENHSQERTLSSSRVGMKRESHFIENSTPGFMPNHSKVGEEDAGPFSVAKHQRLERKMPSMDNDHALSPSAQQDSDNPMVNGDLKDEHRNKLIDKLLDKDLHIPLNGICGIDPSELDLMASDGERLSGSKASTPDLLDSETNSDFGKYLEESDTDTALFSDILSGDLRIDPMENGSRKESVSEASLGIHETHNAFRSAAAPGLPVIKEPFTDGAAMPGAKQAGAGAVIQEKVPIPAMRPEPQNTAGGSLYNQYNQEKVAPNLANRHPASMDTSNPTPSSWCGSNNAAFPVASAGLAMPSGLPAPRAIQPNPNAFSENRTKAAVTPGASVYESSNAHNRRATPAPPPVSPLVKGAPPIPSGNVPPGVPAPHRQAPPIPSGNALPGSPHSPGPTNALTASAIEGLAQFARDGVPGQPVESFKPFRCRWETCTSSFDSSKALLNHVVSTHVPRDNLMMSCMWEGCPTVRRSRSSLVFHLQQKHSEPSPVTTSAHPPPAQPPVAPPITQAQAQPQAQAPTGRPQAQPHSSASVQTSVTPAYHFIARMLQSLQGDEESPLTKTIRLTAALVLRNIAQYSAVARSMLRRHERHLSLVAMSNSEAAHAVAACLSELSPHRKPSSDEADLFVWATDS